MDVGNRMSKVRLKETWELTEKDRKDIYEYAMQRSAEIVAAALEGVDEEELTVWGKRVRAILKEGTIE